MWKYSNEQFHGKMDQTLAERRLKIFGSMMALLATVLQLGSYCVFEWRALVSGRTDVLGQKDDTYLGLVYFLPVTTLILISLFCDIMTFNLGVASSVKGSRVFVKGAILFSAIAIITSGSATIVAYFAPEQTRFGQMLKEKLKNCGNIIHWSCVAEVCNFVAFFVFVVSVFCSKRIKEEEEELPPKKELIYFIQPDISKSEFFGVNGTVTDIFLQYQDNEFDCSDTQMAQETSVTIPPKVHS